MAEEDQTQKCSNNSSSGNCSSGVGNIVRSSKKQKPKKAPQRGLGVAQLERIRLEEQQKKDAATVLPSSQSSTLSATKSSSLSVPTPNYHHPSNHSSSSNSIPFPSDVSSPNSIFRPSSSSVQCIETQNSNIVPLTNPLGWSSVPIQGQGNVHKMYNSCEYNLGKESSAMDQGSSFHSSLSNLPYESIPIWPLPILMHRAQQFQHPSSMVYESAAAATSSSSVLNFQMEPPSNQSCYSNHPPMWPEEEKMVGIKRSYPFSLDHTPSFSSFSQHKFLPVVHPRISRSEDSASCGISQTHFFKPGSSIAREVSSCSSFILEPNNSKKSIKENGVFSGEFLTLAPPTTTSMCEGSKFKRQPPHFLAFHNTEFPDVESLPHQGSVVDPILRLGSNQRQPYYSFFPQSMPQIGQATSTMNSCNNGEVTCVSLQDHTRNFFPFSSGVGLIYKFAHASFEI